MKQQVIGFDLDDTLFPTMRAMLRTLDKGYFGNRILRYNDITSTNRNIIPGYESAQKNVMDIYHTILSTPKIHLSIKPLIGAIGLIKRLHQHGNVIHLIVNRPEEYKDISLEWLQYYFPNIFDANKLHFARVGVTLDQAITKSQICNDLGVLVMVDDGWNNVKDISDHSPHVDTIYMPSRPWNQKFHAQVPEHPRVTIMENLSEILI